ncbi:MAG: hypothetical protein COB15_15815 [Flavobacteriales bacterium]|nr:MAG: hypothetical protein COB15_15815 [Flavobacteriales bacterium]
MPIDNQSQRMRVMKLSGILITNRYYREIDGSNNYHLDYIETTFSEIKGILSQFDGEKNG